MMLFVFFKIFVFSIFFLLYYFLINLSFFYNLVFLFLFNIYLFKGTIFYINNKKLIRIMYNQYYLGMQFLLNICYLTNFKKHFTIKNNTKNKILLLIINQFNMSFIEVKIS